MSFEDIKKGNDCGCSRCFFNYSLGCFVLCSKFRFSDIHKVFNGLYTPFYSLPSVGTP